MATMAAPQVAADSTASSAAIGDALRPRADDDEGAEEADRDGDPAVEADRLAQGEAGERHDEEGRDEEDGGRHRQVEFAQRLEIGEDGHGGEARPEQVGEGPAGDDGAAAAQHLHEDDRRQDGEARAAAQRHDLPARQFGDDDLEDRVGDRDEREADELGGNGGERPFGRLGGHGACLRASARHQTGSAGLAKTDRHMAPLPEQGRCVSPAARGCGWSGLRSRR
jgi:hypothetical protein